MDFMAFLFLVLFATYVGVLSWDHWEGARHQIFSDDGRFLRRNLIRYLMAAETEPVALAPDTRLTIQSAGYARRCEVCHQVDRFDADTGLCQRCDHKTL